MVSLAKKIEFLFNKYSNRDFIYCVETSRTITYGNFYKLSCKTANFFIDNGVSPGCKVFFSAHNSIELYLAWFATIIIGAEVVLVDINYSDDLIRNIEDKLTPAICFSEDVERFLCPVITPSILDKSIDSYEPYKYSSIPNSNAIVFTSGTESLPKGVERDIICYFKNAESFSNAIGINNPDKNILNTFPGYYTAGFYNLFIIPMVNGWKVTIIPTSSARFLINFWKIVEKYNVDTLWIVPSIVSLLNALASNDVNKSQPKVDLVLCGTSPLMDSDRNKFKNNFNLNIVENYALSETLFITSQCPGDNDHSTGSTMPNVDIDIGESGEVRVKTPYLFNRYINLSDNDRFFNKLEFFDTGDIGKIEDGRLVITGRTKDLIIRAGINISPKYIENKIASYKRVDEVAVIGMPDSISGEKIICYYCSKSNLDNELRKFSNNNLSSIYRPERFIRLNNLPKTSSGKIKKSELRCL